MLKHEFKDFATFIDRLGATYGELHAFTDSEDNAFTYADLAEAVFGGPAQATLDLRGSAVAVRLPNSPERLVGVLTMLAAGATVIHVPVGITAHQLASILERSRPAAILDQDGYTTFEGGPVNTYRDTAAIMFSSGSTGLPKGIKLSAANLLENVRGFLRAVPADVGERTYSLLPASHSFGHTVGELVPLAAGATIHFPDSTASIDFGDVADQRTSLLVAVPRILEKLADHLESGREIPTLKRVISGGAALGLSTAETLDAHGIEVLAGYGLTETGPVISVNRPGASRLDTVGVPLDGVDVRLSADGVLETRGPSVMLGYLGDDSGAHLEHGGWFDTGDLARIEDDGHIVVLGRTDDLIVLSTGVKLAPQPIEQAILTVPGIDNVILTGTDHKHIVALVWSSLDHDARGEAMVRIAEATWTGRDVEQVLAVLFVEEPLSMEDGTLTATGKPIRRAVLARHAADIEKIYEVEAPSVGSDG